MAMTDVMGTALDLEVHHCTRCRCRLWRRQHIVAGLCPACQLSPAELKRHKCITCNIRPWASSQGRCAICQDKIDKAKRENQPPKPIKFLVYKEKVVALYRDPDRPGFLRSRELRRDASKLPKKRTLDLNTYLEGYTRETIKRLKAVVLAAL